MRVKDAMSKSWNFIGEITEQWIKNCYPTSNAQSIWKYKDRLNSWFEFLGVTDSEFVEGFKRAKDKNQWAKDMGFKIIAFYNDMLQKGYSVNTGRNYASTARAFSRDVCTPLIVRRGKIAKAKSAKGEHEFNQEELTKMFYVADVRGKAVLATGISLGFSVEDFSELRRDFIESLVNKSLTEKIDFIGFDYERAKTGVESRSHLTPEAVNSLKAWFDYIDAKRAEKNLPKSEWVWANGNGNHLDKQTLNDVIKDLVKKANIITTGRVRFHLIRKFVMSAVHSAGFDSWETKRVLGKEIPTSDSTYLQKLSRDVDNKFPNAYDYIRLSGYANKNHTRIEDLESKIQQLEIKLESMAMENQTLRRVIEFAIPKDKVQNVILQLAKEYGVAFATIKGKTPTLNDVITELVEHQKELAKEEQEDTED
jgi:ribosomal protein L17/tRNA splicing endonuclease